MYGPGEFYAETQYGWTDGARVRVFSSFSLDANATAVNGGDTVTFTPKLDGVAAPAAPWKFVPASPPGSTLACVDDTTNCKKVMSKSGTMWAYLGRTSGVGDSASKLVTVNAGACGDDRDVIIAEYREFSVNPVPTCSELADTTNTARFTWQQLNRNFQDGNPHHPWGLARSALRTGLDETWTNYSRGTITLSSGYRCPHGNHAVGGVANSSHVHGRAADMKSDQPWTLEEFTLLRNAARDAGAVFLTNWDTYTDRHLHAKW